MSKYAKILDAVEKRFGGREVYDYRGKEGVFLAILSNITLQRRERYMVLVRVKPGERWWDTYVHGKCNIFLLRDTRWALLVYRAGGVPRYHTWDWANEEV